jgi:hypothetical protein
MLVLPSGAVIPFVGVSPRVDHVSVHQWARYVRRGAKLDALLKDCWGRGFSAYDTNMVCSVNGYALCVAELRRRQVWQYMDIGYAAMCSEAAMPVELAGFVEQF